MGLRGGSGNPRQHVASQQDPHHKAGCDKELSKINVATKPVTQKRFALRSGLFSESVLGWVAEAFKLSSFG
jgi:hypothetical protein